MTLSGNAALLATRIGTEIKAVRTEVVKLTGNQTVAGVKTFSSSPIVPTPSGSTEAVPKGYVDTATGLLVPKSLVDAKGDLLVGTANDTVARKAVGTANDRLIVDSAQSDGLRWDAARTVELDWLRDAQGLIGGNCVGFSSADTVGTSVAIRTIEFLVCRLVNGQTIGSIKFRTSTAMAGGSGAGVIALYGSTTLSSTSWARLGSNVTITTDLTAAAGRKSVAYPVGAISGDLWIRCQITLTGAPTTYPIFSAAPAPLALGDSATRPLFGFSAGTTAPAATLDPSAFSETNAQIACQLAA